MSDDTVDRMKLRIRAARRAKLFQYRAIEGKGGVVSIAPRSAVPTPLEGATRPMTMVLGPRAKGRGARFSFLGNAVERRLADAFSGAGLALDPIPPMSASRFTRDDRLALQNDTIAVLGDQLRYRSRRPATAGMARHGRHDDSMNGETPESHAE